MSKFLKQSNHIRDEHLDLLETLQEHREQLHVLVQSTHVITKMHESAEWINIRERRIEKIDLVAR